MFLLYYCVISSLFIGGWMLYDTYQSDKDEINWVRNPKTLMFVKVLSADSPMIVKFSLATAFIPFFNIFWLVLLICDHLPESRK